MMPLTSPSRGRWFCSASLLAASLLVACGANGSSSASREAAGPAVVAGLPQDAAAATATASGNYLAGSFALDQGDVRSAADFLGRALARNPGNAELQQQVFLLTLSRGDIDEAVLDQARRLAEASLEAEEARLLLALDEVRAGDFEEARRRLEAMGDGGIAGIVTPLLRAWAVFGAGATDDALARLDAASGDEAMGPLHAYHRAMMLHLAGRSEEAVGVMRAAMPETGRAPLRMVRALGAMLHAAGRADEARRLYEEQFELSGDGVVLEDDLTALERGDAPPAPFEDAAGGMADALLGIAEALEQQRSSTRAVVYARLAEFVHPGYAEAGLLIGDIFAAQGNNEEAVRAYRGIDDGGDSSLGWEARLRAAQALHALERQDDAFELLRAMADERPDRTEPLVALGNLLRRDEEYGPAETAYSRAIERIDELEPRHWPLLYSRGIAYERTKRWPQAEADFLKALELEPEQPFVLNYLGYSWVEQGMNLERAQDMLRRAVELRPNDGFIVDSLGWVYYRLGKYGEAVEQLEQAVELEPGDPVINDHLGDAYWRVGRKREAEFQWRRALTLEPEERDAVRIREKLERGLTDDGGDESAPAIEQRG